MELHFNKSGKEIKQAISNRIKSLKNRLEKRDKELDKFLDKREKVRSYVLRNTQMKTGGRYYREEAPLYDKSHISSEEVEETHQLCTRIMEIEKEISRLQLIQSHLDDSKEFNLKYTELVNYGFTPS